MLKNIYFYKTSPRDCLWNKQQQLKSKFGKIFEICLQKKLLLGPIIRFTHKRPFTIIYQRFCKYFENLFFHKAALSGCFCCLIQALNNSKRIMETRERVEIHPELTEKTFPGHCLRSGVFIVCFKYISHLLLPFLTLSMQLLVGIDLNS